MPPQSISTLSVHLNRVAVLQALHQLRPQRLDIGVYIIRGCKALLGQYVVAAQRFDAQFRQLRMLLNSDLLLQTAADAFLVGQDLRNARVQQRWARRTQCFLFAALQFLVRFADFVAQTRFVARERVDVAARLNENLLNAFPARRADAVSVGNSTILR